MANKVAYFAGGCFWCITPIFKMAGAEEVTCGYCGGDEINPTYEQVKSQQTRHRESVAVYYDDTKLTYEKLLEIFLNNVDPFDEGGQYIDRGYSYTLAVYFCDEWQKKEAEKKILEIEKSTGKKSYIAIEPLKYFYKAEEYHQDYYLKNEEEFKKEIRMSHRDEKKYNL